MPMSQDLEQVDHDSDKLWATVGIAVKETTVFTWYIVLIVTWLFYYLEWKIAMRTMDIAAMCATKQHVLLKQK
jgi:hypothetical protein